MVLWPALFSVPRTKHHVQLKSIRTPQPLLITPSSLFEKWRVSDSTVLKEVFTFLCWPGRHRGKRQRDGKSWCVRGGAQFYIKASCTFPARTTLLRSSTPTNTCTYSHTNAWAWTLQNRQDSFENIWIIQSLESHRLKVPLTFKVWKVSSGAGSCEQLLLITL